LLYHYDDDDESTCLDIQGEHPGNAFSCRSERMTMDAPARLQGLSYSEADSVLEVGTGKSYQHGRAEIVPVANSAAHLPENG
jgi:hypothetical protein